jgi:hypothetical protein
MNPAIARIILRYISGALVAYGVFSPEDANALAFDHQLVADVAIGVGALITLAVEGFYWLARKFGWRT